MGNGLTPCPRHSFGGFRGLFGKGWTGGRSGLTDDVPFESDNEDLDSEDIETEEDVTPEEEI